jgi:hypothetical protein
MHTNKFVDPRLKALDRWLSRLRWYDKLPLVLSVALLVVLPIEILNLVTQSAASSAVGYGQGDFLPEMLHTTEIYIVTCRNEGKPPEIARYVARDRAVKIANEYGVALPNLVADRIEAQVRKHYSHGPAKDRSIFYRCSVQ